MLTAGVVAATSLYHNTANATYIPCPLDPFCATHQKFPPIFSIPWTEPHQLTRNQSGRKREVACCPIGLQPSPMNFIAAHCEDPNFLEGCHDFSCFADPCLQAVTRNGRRFGTSCCTKQGKMAPVCVGTYGSNYVQF